jgi:DNA mismatch repair protein MutS2
VVEHAQASLTPESREARDLIAYLHRSRDEMEEVKSRTREELAQIETERRLLQTEWVDRQKKRIAELEKSFQETTKRLESEMARVTSEIHDRALRARLEKQSGKQISKIASEARAEADAAVVDTLSSSQADLGVGVEAAPKLVAPETLTAGLRIIVKGFKQPLIFRRLDGSKAEVEAGILRMRVPVSDVIGLAAEEKSAKADLSSTVRPRGITVHTQQSEEPANEEINVIGCTVEEATRRVDKFLDQAALGSLPSIRIIHGHGMGALRRGLAEFLSTHPLVDKVRHEAEDRGGTAITIAELRT